MPSQKKYRRPQKKTYRNGSFQLVVLWWGRRSQGICRIFVSPTWILHLIMCRDHNLTPAATHHHSILDARWETFVRISECYKSHNITDSILNTSIQQSMVMLRSTTLNACWQIVWPEANDFWEFPRQWDETGYSPTLNDKVPGEGFSNFNEADIQNNSPLS